MKLDAALLLEAILSEGVDLTAGYIQRGRSFSNLVDLELIEQWKTSVRQCADDPLSADATALRDDLTSELMLRDLKVPNEEIEHEIRRGLSATKKIIESGDQEFRAALKEALLRQMTGFVEKRDRTKN